MLLIQYTSEQEKTLILHWLFYNPIMRLALVIFGRGEVSKRNLWKAFHTFSFTVLFIGKVNSHNQRMPESILKEHKEKPPPAPVPFPPFTGFRRSPRSCKMFVI